MPEILLHYIWQQRLWAGIPQFTTTGLPIEILSVGRHNRDAGPDFSHAHLRINGQEWVGNIEIHVRASDWRRHHHHTNPAYDNVILHIVCDNDEQSYNSRGESLTQCVLQYPANNDYLTQLIAHARQMDNAFNTIPCSQQLLNIPTMLTEGWRQTLLRERWLCKTQSINQLLAITQQNWVKAFYISLAHNFGFHTNNLPFESLALQTPLMYLLKHRNSVFQVTAMLLGQSGLLNESTADTEEHKALFQEYLFLKHKFSLTPINATLWKKARMRPQNAPELRIRQFAQLICQSEFLFSQSLEKDDIHALRALLQLQPIPNTEPSYFTPAPPIGKASIDILLINTILPYRYAYALARNNTAQAQQAIDLLTQLPPENNRIIRLWQLVGQHATSAAETQALIHLYQHYCQHEQCIHCEVGHVVFMTEEHAMD
ncbi:MAG: DUF2851 family protein [Paludibacteraceae bacterium]|nr:DUF2851 family protein [Paludibacteraceae bacterium]